ncbi:MAG: hypothetical protein ABFD06_06375 [Smithella sp.]|jgi:archaellum component FlaC
MNELWTWGLIASLILLAVSTSIKTASSAVSIKRLNHEINTLRKKIESINQKYDEVSQKQSEIHVREKAEFTELINNLTSQITYLKVHSVPLTPDIDPRLTYEYSESFDEANAKKIDKT